MPTADATLLPPPIDHLPSEATRPTDLLEDRGSVRRLDEVGVETVLGAMVEAKKRASQPAVLELELDFPSDVRSEREGGERERAPSQSEVFLKAR